MMVFASLLEYAAVGYLNKRQKMLKEINRRKNGGKKFSTQTSYEQQGFMDEQMETRYSTTTLDALVVDSPKTSVVNYQHLYDSPGMVTHFHAFYQKL